MALKGIPLVVGQLEFIKVGDEKFTQRKHVNIHGAVYRELGDTLIIDLKTTRQGVFTIDVGEGELPVQEYTTVYFTSGSSITGGDYFYFWSPNDAYYMWFNKIYPAIAENSKITFPEVGTAGGGGEGTKHVWTFNIGSIPFGDGNAMAGTGWSVAVPDTGDPENWSALNFYFVLDDNDYGPIGPGIPVPMNIYSWMQDWEMGDVFYDTMNDLGLIDYWSEIPFQGAGNAPEFYMELSEGGDPATNSPFNETGWMDHASGIVFGTEIQGTDGGGGGDPGVSQEWLVQTDSMSAFGSYPFLDHFAMEGTGFDLAISYNGTPQVWSFYFVIDGNDLGVPVGQSGFGMPIPIGTSDLQDTVMETIRGEIVYYGNDPDYIYETPSYQANSPDYFTIKQGEAYNPYDMFPGTGWADNGSGIQFTDLVSGVNPSGSGGSNTSYHLDFYPFLGGAFGMDYDQLLGYYLMITSSTTAWYIWFNVDGGGGDPGPLFHPDGPEMYGIQIDVDSTMVQPEFYTACYDTLHGHAEWTVTDSTVGGQLDLESTISGESTWTPTHDDDFWEHPWGPVITTTLNSAGGGGGGSLNINSGDWFEFTTFHNDITQTDLKFVMYFSVDGTDNQPSVPGAYAYYKVDVTTGQTADNVAWAVADILNTTPADYAGVVYPYIDSETVRIYNLNGADVDPMVIGQGITGGSVVTMNVGQDANPTGIDPNHIGKTGIMVNVNSTYTATQIADAVRNKINAEADFVGVPIVSNRFQMYNVDPGAVPDVVQGQGPNPSSIIVTQQGVNQTTVTPKHSLIRITSEGKTAQITSESSAVGIVQEVSAQGDNARVALIGGVSEGHSGLTPGAKYYIQTDFSLSTNVTAYPFGKALTTTELLLTRK